MQHFNNYFVKTLVQIINHGAFQVFVTPKINLSILFPQQLCANHLFCI